MVKKTKTRFWSDTSRYGVVHKCLTDDSEQAQRCLLIFVHGLFGDNRKTWGNMPKWVLENAGIEIDVISFSYPSRSWQRCSISQAADDLGAWLDTEYQNHRHLLFVTHSTGGLVVKRLLRDRNQQLQEEIANRSDIAAKSIWLRTRRVLNIAVPHLGGSWFISNLGNLVYQTYYFFLAPFLGLIRFITQGNRDWGRNKIIPALCSGNPKLLDLENAFLDCQENSQKSDQLFPVTQDICAKSDLSVSYQSDPAQRQIFIRGTHSSIKIPTRVNDPIVSITADLVRQYGAERGVDLVDATLHRIALVNRTTDTTALISTSVCGIGNDQDRPIPSIANSSFGTQAEIAEKVVTLVSQGSEQPKKIVVTGASGVGKTSVMRHICLRLGVQYLADPDTQPIPLLIPMQQITASHSDDVNYSWDILWQWWIDWGTTLFPGRSWDRDWLEKKFQSSPTTIILDGLDDFLHNHNTIGFSTIVKLLRDAESRYVNNGKLSIIIGVRNTIHGINRLVNDPADIFEILRLSLAEAKQLYPSCNKWIGQVKDRELLEFILTPLILSNYRPDPSCQMGDGSITQSALLCQTVRTVLSRSGLVGIPNPSGREIEIEHLGRAMMIIAWLFFQKGRGDISIDILQQEATQLHQRWKDFFHSVETNDETFYLETIRAESDDILLGFQLATQPEICNALLQRTLFLPTGTNSVRFIHRHWQEFMLGQYLSLCIRLHHFDELGIAAFNSRIYRMAGDSFGDRVVSKGCVNAMFEHWNNSKNTYVSGNIIAFLAWTKTAIEPLAVQLLLSEHQQLEPLSRLVLFAGLGYRVLVNPNDDVSVNDIRQTLFPHIQQYANRITAPIDDPVVSSLSWMYQKSYAERFGLTQPDADWPEIGFKDSETMKALPMVCTIQDGELIVDDRARSLQIAFLVPVMEAFKDPNLAIRALHYLYYLIVARKHGVHIVGLSQDLSVLLAENCEFEKIIAAFHCTPELLTLYKRCQAYHAELESGSISAAANS